MRFTTTLGAFLVLFLCVSTGNSEVISYKELLANNNVNIQQLKIGMNKDQVVALMKTYTANIRGKYLQNPAKTEVFQRDGNTYEILYYTTKKHGLFKEMKDEEASPVILKNGLVIGWGWPAVSELK
jgi:hypothetical protein